MGARWPWLAALLVGCASGPAPPMQREVDRERPMTLELESSHGERLPLAQLRGEPVLLFLFATFDDASQLALTPLIKLHRKNPGLRIIGIALQPKPAALLRSYATALDIDFALASEPQGRLLSGDTALGKSVTVPMFVALDGAGRITGTYSGLPARGELEQLMDDLLDVPTH